ncbi:MAG: polyprenyl synthetase family protein [Asgard group archaeon]|nr:polyprenyl synthetase family protein [Asgard group archaeon]
MIQDALIEVIQEVIEELNKLFTEKSLKREQLDGFGEIFYQEFDRYLSGGGKRVRPFLVKTAFEAVGGDYSEGNLMRAALAIELLHNGSLLHDDVIDKDETRRGKPAFHVLFRNYYQEKLPEKKEKASNFGEAISIFAGDLCFPYAIESLVQSGFSNDLISKSLHAFAQGFKQVIDGVILETGHTMKPTISEEEYLKIIHLKTGALIRKAVEIGAILGKGTRSQINALTEYCNHLGKAFQIQDDILGIYGNPDKLGKPIGGDIREAKQTLLRIYSMTHGTKEQKKFIQNIMGKENLTTKELEKIQQIFKETGALEYAMKAIVETSEKARKALDKPSPELKEKPKQLLIELSQYLENRQK